MHARRLYAHRGASAELPENTLPAFERALEIGVDALETDVHLTRDGALIVSHDDAAARMCAVPATWTQLTLDEVKQLDAGWGFVGRDGTRPFAGQGFTVPTFAELLDACPDVRINVDIKAPAATQPLLELVAARDAADRVTIASFDTGTALAVRRASYRGETVLSSGEVGALLALPALVWRQLPYTGNAAQVPVQQGPLRFDRAAFIAKCHSVGLRIDFWTIDDPAEAERLLTLGADGIMTNDPAALRTLFA